MVKICTDEYPVESEIKYASHFEKYPFPLSAFQKFAIEAIIEGHHALSCVPTGSGKTLSAEFAIQHFFTKGKKTIYTAPIKALSNQKFYEFSRMFPHISFGIITGDIKTNPEADVLIMTTEILMNALYSKQLNKSIESVQTTTSFEMNFETELACVVFDEVHMIGDENRGRVWEETIMMLPRHVQMVMLSATLDDPVRFARWCEGRLPDGVQTTTLPNGVQTKHVYLSASNKRIVPLSHYSFITCTQGLFKHVKDKAVQAQINAVINKPLLIQSANGQFSDENYHKIQSTLKIFDTNRHYVKRQHMLNSVSSYMVENAMLPAICFVLSRKALEQCANEVTTVLLEDDSKVPYIVRKECEQFIRKLPNSAEYLELPEFNHIVSLLEKGVAIHHAGMMSVLREMVEMLFAKGYIKMLFATETFSIGINMPAKTSVFIDISKFDGSKTRFLHPHEYMQMAGRAGRRGIDTVGHVIHLTNLFKNSDLVDLRTTMNGRPQLLRSKFRVGYNLILNLMDNATNGSEFLQNSMCQMDANSFADELKAEIARLETDVVHTETQMTQRRLNIAEVAEYIDLCEKRLTVANKKRKIIERSIADIREKSKQIDSDVISVKTLHVKQQELTALQHTQTNARQFLETQFKSVETILTTNGFLEQNDIGQKPSPLGQIAVLIRETHSLVFAEQIMNGALVHLTTCEIAGVLSCFGNVSAAESLRSVNPSSSSDAANRVACAISARLADYAQIETDAGVCTGSEYEIQYDIIEATMSWCKCETDIECKGVVENLTTNKGIFLGEFIKALLKVNNICSELEKVAEHMGNLEFLQKVQDIPKMTLKYVATNQSLYV